MTTRSQKVLVIESLRHRALSQPNFSHFRQKTHRAVLKVLTRVYLIALHVEPFSGEDMAWRVQVGLVDREDRGRLPLVPLDEMRPGEVDRLKRMARSVLLGVGRGDTYWITKETHMVALRTLTEEEDAQARSA